MPNQPKNKLSLELYSKLPRKDGLGLMRFCKPILMKDMTDEFVKLQDINHKDNTRVKDSHCNVIESLKT